MKTIASIVCTVALTGGFAATHAGSAAASKPVTVEIKDAQGQSVGTALLTEAPHGVKIKLDVKGLPAGGDCFEIILTASAWAAAFKSPRPPLNGSVVRVRPSGRPH